MTEPWFFDDVAFDAVAAESAAAACLITAATLESAAAERWRRALEGLSRCAGPFAEDLAAAFLRACARDVDLARACRRLAATIRGAAADAAAEQAHREVLRDAFRTELVRDEARAGQRRLAGPVAA
jgi:hypothetical protein